MEEQEKLIKAFSVLGNGGGISELVTPTIVGDHNNRITDYTALVMIEVRKDEIRKPSVGRHTDKLNPDGKERRGRATYA